MLIYLNNFLTPTFFHYNYSLILLNILVYVILLFNIFSIFFLFDLRYLKTLSDFKFIGTLKSISIYIVILLMSFAGIPPLVGFVSKFMLFLVLFKKSTFMFIFFLSLFNFFVMYFYLQNFRFLNARINYNNVLTSLNLTNCEGLVGLIVFLNYINLFGVVYIDDVLLYFISLVSGCVF